MPENTEAIINTANEMASNSDLIEYFVAPIVVAIIILIAQFFLQPIIQRKITSKCELWKQKRDVFLQSIFLTQRKYDASIITGLNDHTPTANNMPTTQEKNEILAQLYLISKNKEIPKKFMNTIDGESSPADIAEYTLLVRKELYNSQINLNPENEMGVFYTRG